MHPELIKAHLRMRGTTPAAVADGLGVTRTAVAHVITGKTKSQRIRARLAQVIGKPIDELWPEGAKPGPGLRRAPQVTEKMRKQMAQMTQQERDRFGFPADTTVLGGI